MSIRAQAAAAESAAHLLAAKGRGWFGHRERHTERIIGEFVAHALSVPPGGVLPQEVRATVHAQIERTIDALETYVARSGDRSRRRALHDTGVVKLIYALRDVEQHLLQTQHLFALHPGHVK